MPVLKANAAPVARAVPFSMADVEQHARNVLLRARQQAEELLVHAQKDAEELRKQGYAEGLEAGCRDGFAQGLAEGSKGGHQQALEEHREQFATAIAALNAATAELEARRRELDSAALREVVQLTIKVAERVTKRHGEYDESILLANLGDCLRLVVGAHDLRIAVHPTQRSVLADAMPRLQLEFPALAHVEVVEDEAVSPGGCRLFTRQGLIDADLDAQLSRIAQELVPEP